MFGRMCRKMTRRDALEATLEGLDAAARTGFRPIKINAVIERDKNLGEVAPLARLAREHGFVLRFIEYMPIGMGDAWQIQRVVPNAEILEILRGIGPLEPVGEPDGTGPAQRWSALDQGHAQFLRWPVVPSTRTASGTSASRTIRHLPCSCISSWTPRFRLRK